MARCCINSTILPLSGGHLSDNSHQIQSGMALLSHHEDLASSICLYGVPTAHCITMYFKMDYGSVTIKSIPAGSSRSRLLCRGAMADSTYSHAALTAPCGISST